MRYLTANYVFPVSGPPIKNGVVIIDDEERIAEVVSKLKTQDPQPETFNGILCPGFINAHCHLELSHMKGAIPEKEGLTGFIRNFISKRKTFSAREIEKGIAAGEQEMLDNGIVAVGDICNVADTFKKKAEKNLQYYNFIEGFDFFPAGLSAEYARMISVAKELKTIFPDAQSNLVPHAPYSVSDLLFRLLGDIDGENGKVVSLHSQESAEEDRMFREKKGKIIEFFTALGMDFSRWEASGKSSLQTVLHYLPKNNNVLLVHNTFTDEADIKFAESYSKNIYWVTCPNANLYIEDRLPDYKLFTDAGAKMSIGTDSLASNHSLSILDEMKTISSHFPEIGLDTLLQWATLNGAEALGFQNELGSFEAGKKPGVILIENVDLEKLALTEESKITRLA